MSTNPVLVPISLVSQFLANEKIASRHWLQCQMECLLDQVFDQLSTKLEDYLASNAITSTAHHTTIDTDHIQHQLRHEPSFQAHSHPQFQATTNHLINTEFLVAVGQTQNRGQIINVNRHVNTNEINSEINPNKDRYSLDYQLSNRHLTDDINDAAVRVVSDEIHVKEEFDDTNDEISTSDQSSHIALPVNASTSNKQSNLTNENDEEYDLDSTRDDEQLNGYGYIENDAQMDCDEVEVKEEINDTNNQLSTTEQPEDQASLTAQTSKFDHSNGNDDDEHSLDGDDEPPNEVLTDGHEDNDRIEHNEWPLRPRKKPRLETKQPNTTQTRVTRQSVRLENCSRIEKVQLINEQSNFDEMQSNEQTEPTEADQTNERKNQDKRIITLSVQCLQTGCSQMFNNKTELNAHMRTQYKIFLFRCIVKDCKQSFSKMNELNGHIKQVHPHTSQWHCDKCANHYPTYKLLYRHNYHYHQLGQYQCAFPNCTITAEHRQKVCDHYKNHHSTVEFICQNPQCNRRFNDQSNFKKHQQTHLGVKPYRCKWPACSYAATNRSNTIRHIKNMHLKQGSTETSQVDPREYLEMIG